MKKTKYESFDEYFSGEIRPIFEKVANEVSSTRVSGEPNFVYRPHNLSRWIGFDKFNFDPDVYKTQASKGNVPLGYYISCEKINYDSEFFIQFEHYNFTVKKNTVKVYLKSFSKKVFSLPISLEGCDKVEEILFDVDKLSLQALKCFIKIFGGKSDYKIVQWDGELKFENDEILCALKKEDRWSNEVCKKVYHEKNIEFKSSAYLQNFILGLSVRNNQPEIADAINNLVDVLKMNNPLRYLKDVCKYIDDVIRNEGIILLLNEDEKREFERWLFYGINGA